jgi:hypothetical protein
MLALGGLLICGALLALAGFAIVFRSPNPPRWTTWSDGPVTIAVIATFAFGFAEFIAGASRAYEEGVSLVDLGLLAAVLVAAFAIGRGLRRHAAAVRRAPVPRITVDLRPTAVVTPANVATVATEPPPSKRRPRAA